MKHTLVRIAIGVPAAFNALSAIGGGIVLLAGTYKDGILIEREGKPSSRWSGYKTRRSAITPFPRSSWRLASAGVRSSPRCWSSQAAKRANSRL